VRQGSTTGSRPGRRQQDGQPSGPSDHALARTVLRFAIALRCGGVAAAIIAAGVGDDAGVSRPWQAVVLAGLAAWAVLFTMVAIRRGLSLPLVAGDVLVVALALLAQPHYVSVTAVTDETTWAIMLASTSIYVAQLAIRPPAGLLLAVLVIAAYQAGAPVTTSQPRVMIVQTLAVSAIMELLRRAGRKADSIVAARDAGRRRGIVEAARRADEREQRSRLHDSVLATLTMVATGAVEPGSAGLRSAAERSIAIMEDHAPRPRPIAGDDPPVDLAELMTAQVAGQCPRLRVDLAVAPISVPEPVARAITEAVCEALRNVERHARTGRARLRATRSAGAVTVEITDEGQGFSPAHVPDSRHGIRDSIVGRVAAAGGRADVRSAPGQGTRITLRWPRD
jgi:signal transduction histidine kinase